MSDDIPRFLAEDIGHGDITTETLIGNERAVGTIWAKSKCVIAGLVEADHVFEHMGLNADMLVENGERVELGTAVMRVRGRARDILASERLILNFIMLMSGIATATRDLVDRANAVNPKARVAGTRKTTPGFRQYEKRAIMTGGGDPHRFRLDDQILIKDNHLKLVGSIAEAIERAKTFSYSKKIEVEVRTLEQAEEAARAGADIILLDNMTPEQVAEAAKSAKRIDENILIEISGGIGPETIADYAPYADIISVGYITHSAPAADFSMDVEKIEDK